MLISKEERLEYERTPLIHHLAEKYNRYLEELESEILSLKHKLEMCQSYNLSINSELQEVKEQLKLLKP
jgi:chromosome segregation ATPase